MAENLDRLKKILERYALLAVFAILLLTALFFYFFFILPDREAKLLTDHSAGNAYVQSSVAGKVERIQKTDQRKRNSPEIPVEAVRGLTGK
jgi:hypothetical protein